MPSVPVPASPQIDATLQMAPLPAGTMKRSCCCTHRNTPLRLILRVCCHLSQESSRSGVPSPPTPAALSAIELAVCVDHRLRHRLDRGRGGDVSLQGERLATAIVVIQPQHLIARIDPRHEHHQRVVRWERDNASEC